MGYLTLLRPDDVTDYDTFSRYCQQELGTPLATGRDRVALVTNVKDYWTKNGAVWGNWTVFTQTVAWAKAKRKRPRFCFSILSMIRDAYAAGYVPALAPRPYTDEDFLDNVYEALAVEKDPLWRGRLLSATSLPNGREVLSEWKRQRV